MEQLGIFWPWTDRWPQMVRLNLPHSLPLMLAIRKTAEIGPRFTFLATALPVFSMLAGFSEKTLHTRGDNRRASAG